MKIVSTSQKEQLMRDYWLGTLSAAEVESLEDQWLDTNADAGTLAAIRDDLIADYLSKELPAGEKLLFEKNFLAVPANLRDTAIAKSFRKLIDEEKVLEFGKQPVSNAAPDSFSFWQKLKSLSAPRFARAALLLASLVLAVIAVFIVYQVVSIKNNPVAETARINSPENGKTTAGQAVLNESPQQSPGSIPGASAATNTAAGKNKPPIDKNGNSLRPNENARTTGKNSDLSQPDKVASPEPRNSRLMVATLAFAATATRGGDNATDLLILNTKTKTVRLLIPVKNSSQPSGYNEEYEGTITSTVNDQEIYRVNLGNLGKSAGRRVPIEIPTRLFTSGDYYFSLLAKPAQGGKPAAAPRLVDIFQFRVKKETK